MGSRFDLHVLSHERLYLFRNSSEVDVRSAGGNKSTPEKRAERPRHVDVQAAASAPLHPDSVMPKVNVVCITRTWAPKLIFKQ